MVSKVGLVPFCSSWIVYQLLKAIDQEKFNIPSNVWQNLFVQFPNFHWPMKYIFSFTEWVYMKASKENKTKKTQNKTKFALICSNNLV